MTYKDFLSEVQKSSKLDRQQTSALVSALEHILAEQAIAGNVVSLNNFGQFISHKHLEYVVDNAETGESVLYPPRISYRFNSDIKLK